MNDSIECTVAILTRNSGSTLRRALESVKGFKEVIICDGDSTDDTRAIALEYGARIIGQDLRYIGEDGRLKDFAGVRNQTLAAATCAWFFFLDSDEYASDLLVQEIREITTKVTPRAYWVWRKYMVGGVVIDRSISYPNRQMRLFHRDIAIAFRKPVHERIELVPGTVVAETRNPILVPADLSRGERRTKSLRYIQIDLDRQSPMTMGTVTRLCLRACKLTLLYAYRFAVVVVIQKGARMSLRREFEVITYQWLLLAQAIGRLTQGI